MIVDRERENGWRLCRHLGGPARDVQQGGRPEASARTTTSASTAQSSRSGKDFDQNTGKPEERVRCCCWTSRRAKGARRAIKPASSASRASKKAVHDQAVRAVHGPARLQQEANAKLGFTARAHHAGRTIALRERPHHVHADRLDQPASSPWARPASWSATSTATPTCGRAAHLHGRSVKNARRPTSDPPRGHAVEAPTVLEGKLNAERVQGFRPRLKRTIASQMEDARGPPDRRHDRGRGLRLHRERKTIDFPGYLRAYVEARTTRTRNWPTREGVRR
jgi:hypothetical protein